MRHRKQNKELHIQTTCDVNMGGCVQDKQEEHLSQESGNVTETEHSWNEVTEYNWMK
jgi:hypothetical protein